MAVTSTKAVGLLLLLSTVALCQASSNGNNVTERVVQGIKDVTQMSDSLRKATEKINIFNAPQQGFIIAQGFTGIIAKIAHGIEKMNTVTTGPLPDADAKLVVDALTTFVHVHQALLNVVIGKHGLTTLIPFFEPIRIALVSLEAVIDSFAFDLIGLIPTQKPAATKQFDDLGVTLKEAQTTYSFNLEEYAKLSNTPTTDKVLQGISTVTQMSDQLRVATSKINIFNAPQQGIIIAQGFTTIIAKIAEGITRVDSVTSGPLPDADAKLVVDALTTFVHVHQALLNVVIGKHGLTTLIPFFEPIRIALVSLEAVIDSFAFDLIGLIPTQKPAAQKQFDDLGVTLKMAQTTYSLNLKGSGRLSNNPTTDKILQGFGNVTAMSDNLRKATEKINIFNAPQQGFIIAQGFTVIITKIAEGTTRVDAVTGGPLPDADAKLVVDALTTFVHVHQALLNVVIGKHGLTTMIPFFEPIRIALVSLEAVIDSFAFDLIALIPTQKPAATKQFDDLGVTLKKAQTTYSVTLASVAKY